MVKGDNNAKRHYHMSIARWVGGLGTSGGSPPPPPPPPTPNWTFIQSASTTTALSATCVLAYTANVTAGNLLVAHAGTGGGASAVAITDSQGNTWTQDAVTAKNASDSSFLATWHAKAGATGPNTVTATANAGTPGVVLAIQEFSPGGTFNFTLDGSVNAIFTSRTTTPDAGSIAVAGAHELAVSAWASSDAAITGTITAGTGMTIDQQDVTPRMIATEYALNVSAAIHGAFTLPQTRFSEDTGVSYIAS